VALGHYEFGASSLAGENIDLIHECLHQKHTAAGIAEDILVIAGVGHVLDAKSRSLVYYVDFELVVMKLEDHVDLSLAALFVPVLKRVHDAFVHGEADFVLIVLAKSGGGGDADTHFFGESNALDQRFHYDFNPLRF
jgi:hypothetical protein